MKSPNHQLVHAARPAARAARALPSRVTDAGIGGTAAADASIASYDGVAGKEVGLLLLLLLLRSGMEVQRPRSQLALMTAILVATNVAWSSVPSNEPSPVHAPTSISISSAGKKIKW